MTVRSGTKGTLHGPDLRRVLRHRRGQRRTPRRRTRPAGTRLFDKALPNGEAKLRTVFDRLAEHGPVLVIVDQPNTIGALPVTVARACGHAGRTAGVDDAARRRSVPRPGQDRRRDAFIIADTARTMPHTLRRIDVGDEALAELGVLVGFDDDLAGEATRISNRIRGLLTGIHPALERVLRSQDRASGGPSKSCRDVAGRSASAKRANADSPHFPQPSMPRGWAPDWPRKSSPRSMPRA